jgi:hypothetical protein
LPASTERGYVPCPPDDLFASLSAVDDLLRELKVEYVLGGGTLLGAVRGGNLLPGDSDWDIEIVDHDVPKILGARDRFAARGLVLEYPVLRGVVSFLDGSPSPYEVERRIIKVHDDRGRFHGDLFIQTLFSDGMLRRFNLEEGAYFNAKMTFPYWFVANRGKVRLRDREFFAPAEPGMMLARIYGPRWQVPYKRHGKRIKGYNFAGAFLDAPVEPGLVHALARGWVPRYPDCPRWPREIRWIDTKTTARWIARHEHISELGAEDSDHVSLDDANARLLARYRIAMNRLKDVEEALAEYEGRPPVRWLNAALGGLRGIAAGAWRFAGNLGR